MDTRRSAPHTRALLLSTSLLLLLAFACQAPPKEATAPSTTGQPASAEPVASAPPTSARTAKLPHLAFNAEKLKPKLGGGNRLLVERPRTNKELPTTTCDIFLKNINSQLEGRKRAAAAKPNDPGHQRFLAEAQLSAGELYGNLNLIAEAEATATRAIELDPKVASSLELRAKIRSTLHRFDGAIDDYNKALKLAPDRAPEIELALANVRFQLGDLSSIPIIQREVAKTPSFGTESQAGILYWQLGNPAQAQRHFALAEQLYKDSAPTPLAWLNVQRGLMAMHTGNFPLARTFFYEAWQRCPRYPLAKEHLAEIEGRLGNLDRSIELYTEVVQETSNPEFIEALAEAWTEKGDAQKAKELLIFARSKNEQLLAKHPDAMYWHAAGFYLGIGADPKKALELLEKNVKIRPGASSWAALADAQLQNDQLDKAAASIQKALDSPVDLAEFHWTAARIYKALEAKNPPKDPADSRYIKERDRALAMNPRIVDLEGKIE